MPSEATRNKAKAVVVILLSLLLLFQSLIPITVYADSLPRGSEVRPGEGSLQNGDGYGAAGELSSIAGAGGWREGQEAVRFYMIDKSGQVVTKVLDFWYDNRGGKQPYDGSDPLWRITDIDGLNDGLTAIGDKPKDGNIKEFVPISTKPGILDDLPRITISDGQEGYASNENAIKAWALATDEAGIKHINYVISELFSKSPEGTMGPGYLRHINGKTPYRAYMDDELRLVMEGIWWHTPSAYVSGGGGKPMGVGASGQVGYVLGNIQYIASVNAQFDALKKDGGWSSLCSKLWPTALYLDKAVGLSGQDWSVPDQITPKIGQETVNKPNADGTMPGYGLKVFFPEDTPDKWATHEITFPVIGDTVGSLIYRTKKGSMPGTPPKQDTGTDKDKRPVKIIKIYEDILVKNDGTEEIENSWLKYDWQTSYSRIIEIQDEPLNNPQYKVEHWYTAVDEGPWGSFPWADTWEPWERGYNNSSFKGESSTTVEVPDYHGDQAFDVLIVHRDYSYGYKGCSKSNQVLGGGTLKYF